jgi:hypothetical protein
MARRSSPTMQLCGAKRDGARDAAVCVLPRGHAGHHEGFDSEGKRVKFESSDPSRARERGVKPE